MRELAAACLLFCGLVARGQQPPASVILFPGGFRPRTANFSITFGFSDLHVVPDPVKEPKFEIAAPGSAPTATAWSSAAGTTARLEVCCIDRTMGLSDGTLAAARLWVSNLTARPISTTLTVAIAPQGSLRALAFEKHAFFIEGHPVVIADTPSAGAILAESPFAARSLTPQDQGHVESAKGECRGEMIYDLVLAAGETRAFGFICPVRLPVGSNPSLDFYRALAVKELFAASHTIFRN